MSSGRCKMPIVMRGAIGIGGSNATHHSGNYYPFFAHVPGWRVVVPTTPRDAKGLMKTALRSDDPVLFLEHKTLLNVKGPVPEPEAEELIPFGKAAIRREGTDVTAVAIGAMGRRRSLGRGGRPPLDRAARHRHDPRVGPQDRAADHRRRGFPAGGDGR
jgi:2-oxoisovalerate dehydrogenase E1 component